MKILSIVGARPQFIKLAPLSKIISKTFQQIIVHTGQHFDEEMSKLFFEQLEIPEPDYNLRISGGDHGAQTGQMLISLEEVLIKENPQLVIVFGDTNSTLAGSLVGSKLNIPSIHIEAGLRSFNRSMPEEINRIISDHSCDYLFAPTDTASRNLEKEGLASKTFLTGDIMVDSLTANIERAKKNSQILNELNIVSNQYYLLTLHRPYNVDDPDKLFQIIMRIAELNEVIIFPVHPRTRKMLNDEKINITPNVKFITPQGYLDFICLELNSKKIITDSGGIQKEAYILKRPCITLRPETEWIETVEDGWNILLNTNQKDFSEKVFNFSPNNPQRNVFGSNVVAKMIEQVEKILNN